ncbi:hypothetical protein [Geoalkalibacter sp.]|uniref:hypothetical protein n=1 Tax=Geoalkalibacter sp. TaxID=3041440 RepID=UPI00272ECA00|nr:hypothetical protein [Geoalkalibacter sp.]
MDTQPKSKAEQHIEQIMRHIEPGSERYQALDCAKRFKSSWVDLGERLVTVRNRGLYRDWGYADFDEYCAREIRLRKATAEKLLLAYHFLENNEPQILARKQELRPLPDFRAVDLLRQAQEEKHFPDEQYAQLRKAVVEEERSHPTLLKLFKETAAEIAPPPADPALHYRACLQTARRLEIALRSLDDVPAEALRHLHELLQWLEERLDAIDKTAPAES